jgi:hypothetical protein
MVSGIRSRILLGIYFDWYNLTAKNTATTADTTISMVFLEKARANRAALTPIP